MAHKIYCIYWQIRDPENVCRATYLTIRGKGKRYDVQRLIEKGYIDALDGVWELLETESYVPSKYHSKTIFDGKWRELKIAPLYQDRIIHHCLIDVLEPYLYKIFIANTYACIKGRGIHRCLYDLNKALQTDFKGTKYCLKIDVRHYYDSIVHSILKAICAKYIGDKMVLNLIYTIIDSTEGDVGLPIGFLTSQHFANLYLTPFDHWIKEVVGVRYYYRYMDDIVILSNSKLKLHYILEQIREYFSAKLQLEIKANWQIFPVDARSIDFVGYKSNHYNILARKSILYKFFENLRELAKRYEDVEVTEAEIINLLSCHVGWLQHCSDEHFAVLRDYMFKQFKLKRMSNRLSKGIHSDSVQPTFDVIDKVKGTTLYNFNQHYVEEVQQDGSKKKVNEYDSLRVDYPVNANTVFETLITSKYPNNQESKLLNDFNAAVAGIEDESKKKPYLDFLQMRKELHAMVDADCQKYNYPMQ